MITALPNCHAVKKAKIRHCGVEFTAMLASVKNVSHPKLVFRADTYVPDTWLPHLAFLNIFPETKTNTYPVRPRVVHTS